MPGVIDQREEKSKVEDEFPLFEMFGRMSIDPNSLPRLSVEIS